MKMIPLHETKTATTLAFTLSPIYLCHRTRSFHRHHQHEHQQQNDEHCVCFFLNFEIFASAAAVSVLDSQRALIVGPANTKRNPPNTGCGFSTLQYFSLGRFIY